MSADLRTAIANSGPRARVWLESLNRRIDSVLELWDLRYVGPIPGATQAWVGRVVQPSGEPAVLRLAPPSASAKLAVRTLRAARGHGYVRLLKSDAERGITLTEELGPNVVSQGYDAAHALPIAWATLEEAWRLPTTVVPPPRQEKAQGLLQLLERLAPLAPWAAPAIEAATEHARVLLAYTDGTRQVVVHGDAHPENLLAVRHPRAGAPAGHVYIDIDPFLCEPEYDLGVLLRSWNTEVSESDDPSALVHEWAALIARETGYRADEIWRWAFVERVTTGLFLNDRGLPDLGDPYLRSAMSLLDRSGH
jgi:streptomycin 6-kinase